MSDPNILSPGHRLIITASSTAEPRNGFAFLTNVSGIVGASELELIPGNMLRKAAVDEITIIKEVLVQNNNGRLAGKYFFPWEMERKGAGYDAAPEEDWKYFVIAFSGSNAGIARLEQAFVLLDRRPRIGFTFTAWGSQRLLNLHAGRLFQALQENSLAFQENRIDEQIFYVSPEDAAHIRILVEQLSRHPAKGIDIPRVNQQLLNLEALDINSDVAFLGYFSVLESLLIHKPDPKDPTDSITRQVKKKITLLDNRWTPKLDYSAFHPSKPEDIWSKMYDLRSAIAHGDVPDFKQRIKGLKDPANARSLLTYTVRAVARYALHEPQLVSDLREC